MDWLTQLQDARRSCYYLAQELNSKALAFDSAGNPAMANWLRNVASDASYIESQIDVGINTKLDQGEKESKEAFAVVSKAVFGFAESKITSDESAHVEGA